MLSFASCGKEIEDGPINDNPSQSSTPDNNNTPDNNDATDNTENTDNVTPPENDDEWNYTFSDDFIEDNGISYIWDQLDEDTRIALGEMMNAIQNVDVYVSLSKGFPKAEREQFLTLLTNCTMGYTYDANKFKTFTDDATGMVVGVSLNYNLDPDDVNYIEDAHSRTEAVLSKVDEIVSGMPNGNDFEKVKYLYDTLILNCTYSEDAMSPFTAYGALIEGKATCQGYADAMHLLLDKAGFPTVFATGIGDAVEVTHKWNYVQLSDGNWYVVDATWGDPEGKDDPNYINYDYLLISDEVLLKDHKEKFQSPYYSTPEATSMDFNYHVQMGYVAETYEQAEEIALKQVLECGKNGTSYVYIRFNDKDVFDQAYNGLSKEFGLQSIIKQANKELDDDFVNNSWGTVQKDDTLTLIFTLKR